MENSENDPGGSRDGLRKPALVAGVATVAFALGGFLGAQGGEGENRLNQHQ